MAYAIDHSEKTLRWQNALSEITFSVAPLKNIKSPDPVTTLFTMHGSNTVGGRLAPNLAMDYLKQKGLINIRVQPLDKENEKVVVGDFSNMAKSVQIHISAHGSSTGFKGLMSGEADIWASSRKVKNIEVSKGRALTNLQAPGSEHVLAIDGLAIIVNPKNPISQLSKQQLSDIFSGKITNWAQIGGFNQGINLYARDNNSGTWDSFKNMVLGKKAPLSRTAKRFESSELLVENILIDTGAIGFIGLAFVDESKLLAISDGDTQAFKPSLLTVATEDYALSRRLYLYTDEDPTNPYVKEFVRFCQSIAGQAIAQKLGFISQNVEAMKTSLAKNLPIDYLQLVEGNERLSLNFRFQPGSAKLDNKAIKDIYRLAYFVHQQDSKQELLLIGFGDRRKNLKRSKLLSKLRAMAVRRELAKLGVFAKLSTGYGEFNPVASYSSNKSGQMKNRRVEVWVR
ncbi:MAG: phosphate ABC transporter substrate-binding/OmpA family protein [Bermanella sp.]